jgi:hypothetical protein
MALPRPSVGARFSRFRLTISLDHYAAISLFSKEATDSSIAGCQNLAVGVPCLCLPVGAWLSFAGADRIQPPEKALLKELERELV